MQALTPAPEFHFSVDNYQISATFTSQDDTILFHRIKTILMASYLERYSSEQNVKIDKKKK